MTEASDVIPIPMNLPKYDTGGEARKRLSLLEEVNSRAPYSLWVQASRAIGSWVHTGEI
jgi:hypothetical protein